MRMHMHMHMRTHMHMHMRMRMRACMHVAGGARPAPHAQPVTDAVAVAAAAGAASAIAKPLDGRTLGGGGGGGGGGGSARGEGIAGDCTDVGAGPRQPREGAAGLGVRYDGGRNCGGPDLVGLSSRVTCDTLDCWIHHSWLQTRRHVTLS